MSFGLPQVDPETSGRIEMPVPLGRYLDAAYSVGEHDSILGSLTRMREVWVADMDQNSELLEPDEANKRWAVGDLKFTEPVRESVARVLNRRKREEIDRTFLLDQGSTGLLSFRGAGGLAASMLGASLNPLDLGVMLIPFVGEEAIAAKATGTVGKILARRLITREALREVTPRFPGLSEAVINGVLGQSLFEVPNLIASAQDQATYGIQNAAFNIATGGVLSAGLHGALHILTRMSPETRMAMAKQALNDTLRDEPIRADRYVQIDENAIRAAAEFSATRAENEALASLDVRAIMRDIKGRIPVTAADVLARAPGETSLADIVGMSATEFNKLVDMKKDDGGRLWTPSGQGAAWGYGKPIEQIQVITQALADIKAQNLEALKVMNQPDVAPGVKAAAEAEWKATYGKLTWLGGADQGLKVSAGLMEMHPNVSGALESGLIKEGPPRGIEHDVIFQRKDVQDMVANAADRNMADFVERAKREYDPAKRFSELKQQEIDRQIAEGRVLRPEEVEANQKPPVADETTEAQALKEAEELRAELGMDKQEEKLVKAADKVNDLIKRLDEGGQGMLFSDPFLVATLGKTVLRGLLVAVREGLLLFNDIAKAIDHGLKTLGDKATPEVRSALTKALNEDIPDFQYTIQGELSKEQPFNVKPERFTPQVIMSKLKNLPTPERVALEHAKVGEFLSQFEGTVPVAEFRKFVDSALPQVEVRPMLNVAGDEGSGTQVRRLQHNLETGGYVFDSEGNITKRPENPRESYLKEEKLYLQVKDAVKKSGRTGENELVDEYVSQNVSVPIAFEKMDKPRTVFLAADQDVHVGSGHYGGVFSTKAKITPTNVDKEFVGAPGLFVPEGTEGAGNLFMQGKAVGAEALIKRNKEQWNNYYVFRTIKEEDKWNTRTQVPNKKDMLAWMETHVVTLPDGRRVLHVFEAQSDVRQSFGIYQDSNLGDYEEAGKWVASYVDEKGRYQYSGDPQSGNKQVFDSAREAQSFVDQKLAEYQARVQPLIDHTDEILIKALLKMAKREGLDGVVISDPRTAMLTQGHVGDVRHAEGMTTRDEREIYEPPSQAAGMEQAYGRTLPDLARKASGHPGEYVEMPGTHYIFEDGNLHPMDEAPREAGDIAGFNQAFPGSDSPSGMLFPVDKVSTELPFEYFSPKQVKPAIESIEAAIRCVEMKML